MLIDILRTGHCFLLLQELADGEPMDITNAFYSGLSLQVTPQGGHYSSSHRFRLLCFIAKVDRTHFAWWAERASTSEAGDPGTSGDQTRWLN